MRQIYLMISVIIVGLGSVLLLDWVMQTPTVQAQTDPNAPAAQHTLYLPVIAGEAGTSRIKQTSGIHMGNRGIGSDWPLGAFTLITTDTVEGIWPAATVIQSAQLYNFVRDTAPPCHIRTASIRLTNIYTYLTRALNNGTQVVIRITPSPGNFTDYAVAKPGITHTLLTDETPAGGNYCQPSQPGEPSQVDKVNHYRDILDIAKEMDAIQQLNERNKWPKQQVFFEPANEPNNEWYSYKGITTALQLQRSNSWQQMDDYFSKLYDTAHTLNQNLQILTPPMGQRNFAEIISLGSCDPMRVDNIKWKAGYDFMPKTYNSELFEGYSWHNYWNYGKEQLDIVNVAYCNLYPTHKPNSHHLFQYFPDWLRGKMAAARKPTFVTEADLNSRCQDESNPLQDKILEWEATKASLHDFIANETLATYVIVWLLVQEDDGGRACKNDQGGNDDNYEIYLHEAYHESTGYHLWFREWWLSDE